MKTRNFVSLKQMCRLTLHRIETCIPSLEWFGPTVTNLCSVQGNPDADDDNTDADTADESNPYMLQATQKLSSQIQDKYLIQFTSNKVYIIIHVQIFWIPLFLSLNTRLQSNLLIKAIQGKAAHSLNRQVVFIWRFLFYFYQGRNIVVRPLFTGWSLFRRSF